MPVRSIVKSPSSSNTALYVAAHQAVVLQILRIG